MIGDLDGNVKELTTQVKRLSVFVESRNQMLMNLGGSEDEGQGQCEEINQNSPRFRMNKCHLVLLQTTLSHHDEVCA